MELNCHRVRTSSLVLQRRRSFARGGQPAVVPDFSLDTLRRTSHAADIGGRVVAWEVVELSGVGGGSSRHSSTPLQQKHRC